jgi:hypothetical protein
MSFYHQRVISTFDHKQLRNLVLTCTGPADFVTKDGEKDSFFIVY